MFKPDMPPMQFDASAAERLNTFVMIVSGMGLVAIAAGLVFAHDWIELMKYSVLVICCVTAVIMYALAANKLGGRCRG